MADLSPQNLQYWRKLEEQSYLLGQLPPEDSPDHAIYRALFEWNARKAEGHALASTPDSLLKVRALLLRGRLSEAEQELSTLLAETARPEASSADLATIEVLLENTRLHMFNGRWAEALEACQRALALGPPPVSTMTLHQLRSLIHFERGDMSRALVDLDKMDSLKAIMPEACVAIYGSVLRIRIQARDRSPEAAAASLERLWAELARAGKLDLDAILTLLRTEIDLRRLSRRPFLELAILCRQISEQIGDSLYAALALVDMYAATDLDGRNRLQPELDRAASEYEKVASLLRELRGEPCGEANASSTTGAAMALFQPHEPLRREPVPPKAAALVLLASRLVVTLETLAVHEAGGSEQVFEALLVLRTGTLSKKDFFTRLWGIPNYVPRLHDSGIRTLLHRLRKQLGVDVALKQGFIELQSPAVFL